jgi:ketosteroid isomerase-like protein
VTIVPTLHEAYNRRDRDALLALLADDVVWHVAGTSSMAGTFAGREGVWKGVFEPMWPTPARVFARDVVEHEDQLVALVEWRHNFGDGEQGWTGVEVLRLADGLVAERHEHMSRQAELDRLFERGCAAVPEP